MKKMYSKPEILFESFVMSTNIAGCGAENDAPTSGVCGLEWGGDMIFTEGVSGCKKVVPDGTGGFCYDNPSDISAIFGS